MLKNVFLQASFRNIIIMKNSCIFFVLLFISSSLFAQDTPQNVDFYDTNSIREIKLDFKEKDWRTYLDSLLLNGNEYLLANAVIDGKTYKNVGVRYNNKQSKRTGNKRNPLYIKLNYINSEQKHQDYQNLYLSDAKRDPSMVREVLSYEIARKYMPAPMANYAKVTINDSYYGLFINIEDVNEDFLINNYGDSKGTFIKCSPNDKAPSSDDCLKNTNASLQFEEEAICYLSNFELLSPSGWDDLIELTKVLNTNTKNIHHYLNVDRTLWMLAFNNVTVNLSSYSGKVSQNFYLYKDEKGKFNPIIWDLNLAFGSYKNIGKGSDLKLQELIRLDPLLHLDNPYKPLLNKLLNNPFYEKIYLSHLQTILYDYFKNDLYEKRAEELQKLIETAYINDVNKQYSHDLFKKSLNSTTGKRSKIPGIVQLMSKRTKFLKKHSKIAIIPPQVTNVQVQKRERLSKKTVDDFRIKAKVEKLPKRVKLYYRFTKDENFNEVFMKDDGKNFDDEPGDKVFGVVIPPKKNENTIEYYIVAENAAAISFDPPNYMYQLHQANLVKLNQ